MTAMSELETAESVRASFRLQAEHCKAMGSPFTGRVCALLAERVKPDSEFGRRVLNWPGQARHDALALRAAGGLHALKRSGRCPELVAAYPPSGCGDEELWRAIVAAIHGYDEFLAAYLDSAPQTNEVARSSTILGGCLSIAAGTGMPLDIREIGSSAGLNLGFDQYAYDLGGVCWGSSATEVKIISKWSGRLPDLTAPLAIRSRRGCDLNPLDPGSERNRERLLSYIWPDQTERLARLEAALDAAARAKFTVEKADAADWVEMNFAAAEAGAVKVLLHTVVWQYLPEPTKRRIEAAITKAGAAATKAAPVAWLRVEADRVEGSAAVRLTLWPTGEERLLGRADFHGRWTMWGDS